jgi:hypothetical protein
MVVAVTPGPLSVPVTCTGGTSVPEPVPVADPVDPVDPVDALGADPVDALVVAELDDLLLLLQAASASSEMPPRQAAATIRFGLPPAAPAFRVALPERSRNGRSEMEGRPRLDRKRWLWLAGRTVP